MTLGKRIRYYRENVGMSRAELSAIIKCSANYMYKVENDLLSPTHSKFISICKALNVSPNQLANWVDEDTKESYKQIRAEIYDIVVKALDDGYESKGAK